MNRFIFIFIILLLLGFRKDTEKKYIMIVSYDNNNLSANWYQESFDDTISCDSGCISNKKLEFNSFDPTYNAKIDSKYYIKIYEYSKNYLNYINTCPKERQLTEYGQDVVKILKKNKKYIDTNLIKVQKVIPFLDSSSDIFFTRDHKRNNRKNKFYRIFIVSASKQNLYIEYTWLKHYLFIDLDYLSIHCSKQGTREGEVSKVEIYSNVKIIKEIKCFSN